VAALYPTAVAATASRATAETSSAPTLSSELVREAPQVPGGPRRAHLAVTDDGPRIRTAPR
jgi:hypothetical protein